MTMYRAIAHMIDPTDLSRKWEVRIYDYKTREEAIKAGEEFTKKYDGFKYAQVEEVEIFRVGR